MKSFGRSALALVFVSMASTLISADEIPEAILTIGQNLEAGKYQGVTSGLVSHKGKMLFEAYGPGISANTQHDIRSATKSVTAILIGQLIKKGQLSGVNARLSDILPNEFSAVAAADSKREITIENILTMRSGIACNDWIPSSLGQEDKMYPTEDWASFILRQPNAFERGKHFSYCTGGVVLLGRVIRQLSGKPVPALAAEFLFKPLGIEGASWANTPKGFADTGGHLKLTSRDLLKIGLLIENAGEWQGQELVPAKWVKAMTSEHTEIYERREKFGYLWWLEDGTISDRKISLTYAHGNGGTFIFIVPELKLEAAFTGVNFGMRSQFTAKNLFTREIIPALINAEN